MLGLILGFDYVLLWIYGLLCLTLVCLFEFCYDVVNLCIYSLRCLFYVLGLIYLVRMFCIYVLFVLACCVLSVFVGFVWGVRFCFVVWCWFWWLLCVCTCRWVGLQVVFLGVFRWFDFWFWFVFWFELFVFVCILVCLITFTILLCLLRLDLCVYCLVTYLLICCIVCLFNDLMLFAVALDLRFKFGLFDFDTFIACVLVELIFCFWCEISFYACGLFDSYVSLCTLILVCF